MHGLARLDSALEQLDPLKSQALRAQLEDTAAQYAVHPGDTRDIREVVLAFVELISEVEQRRADISRGSWT